MSGHLSNLSRLNANAVSYDPQLLCSIRDGHSSQVMFNGNEMHKQWLSGVSVYNWHDMPPVCEHDCNEVMYILAGEGTMQMGSELFPIHADMAILVPIHTPHAIACCMDTDSLRIFWVQMNLE